ncbi:MAG: hypothetical protein V9G23_13750 [Giesbergeria sp.]
MTVFMQQLGRGLRLHSSKPALTVLDFIGNYRNAHFKLPFLVGHDLDQELSPVKALNQLRRWQEEGTRPVDLPDGIEVNIEPVAMEALQAAIGLASPLRQLVLDDLAELARKLARAPTLTEWVRLGRYSLSTARAALGVDRWHGVLEVAGLMDDASRSLEAAAGDFLKEIETSSMTRSFKMVVLKAMCEDDAFIDTMPMARLVAAFREYFAEDAHRAGRDRYVGRGRRDRGRCRVVALPTEESDRGLDGKECSAAFQVLRTRRRHWGAEIHRPLTEEGRRITCPVRRSRARSCERSTADVLAEARAFAVRVSSGAYRRGR